MGEERRESALGRLKRMQAKKPPIVEGTTAPAEISALPDQGTDKTDRTPTAGQQREIEKLIAEGMAAHIAALEVLGPPAGSGHTEGCVCFECMTAYK